MGSTTYENGPAVLATPGAVTPRSEVVMYEDDTLSALAEKSIPPPHPINTEILQDKNHVGDEALRLLHRLDVDCEDIQRAFKDVVHRTLDTSLSLQAMGRISDVDMYCIMGWIFWKYEHIPTDMVTSALVGSRWDIKIDPERFREDFITAFQLESRCKEIERLRSMPYKDYLKTEHWQTVREAALERAEHRCQACNDATKLHVHHRTYERRGEENPTDVVALCADCHRVFHEHRKVVR